LTNPMKTRSGKRHRSFDTHLLLLFLLVLIGSFLTTVSIAADEYAWAVWIGLFPLLIAIRLFPPLWAMLSGGAWGLGIFVFSHFVPGADSHIPFTFSSAALLSAIPAIYACTGGFISGLIGFRPLILALGWIGVEIGLKPFGIHDGLFVMTNGTQALILIIGGILGYSFIGFLIVFAGAFLLDLACAIHFHPIRCKSQSPVHDVLLTSPPENILTGLASIILQPAKPRAPPVPLFLYRLF
jgi:apolipoprotein N-acyltransferase